MCRTAGHTRAGIHRHPLRHPEPVDVDEEAEVLSQPIQGQLAVEYLGEWLKSVTYEITGVTGICAGAARSMVSCKASQVRSQSTA